MPAGYNRVCQVIRFSYPNDDSSGGAVPSGTVVYQNVNIRIQTEKPTMALVEQGLQVPTLSTAFVFGNIIVEHNDQIQFTAPVNDWYYSKRFRVIGVRPSGNHPAQDRNQTEIILKRWELSHGNDYQ